MKKVMPPGVNNTNTFTDKTAENAKKASKKDRAGTPSLDTSE